MSHENDVRDHALSRLYREGAWPEPGRQIDQAILAASRRASRERHPLIWRWAPPFAVAATVVLTSAVALKAYREKPEIVAPVTLEEAPAVRAKQAAPERKTEAKPAPAPTPAAPAQPSVTTPQGFSSSMDMLEAERLERAKRDLGLKDLPPPGTPVQAAKPVPSAKAPPALKKEADTTRADVTQRSAPISVFGASAPASTPQPPAAATQPPTTAPQAARAVAAKPAQAAAQAPRPEANEAPAAAQSADEAKPAPAEASAALRNALGATAAGAVVAKERSPQTWIEDIRKLMKEGLSEEAGGQLAEFKKRYPDYVLPEDLR